MQNRYEIATKNNDEREVLFSFLMKHGFRSDGTGGDVKELARRFRPYPFIVIYIDTKTFSGNSTQRYSGCSMSFNGIARKLQEINLEVQDHKG